MVGGQQNDATEKTNPGTRGSGGGGDRDSTTSAEVLQDIAVSTTTENTADERAQRTHGRAASASRSSRCCRCSKLSWSSASLYALSFLSRSFANYGPNRHAAETHTKTSAFRVEFVLLCSACTSDTAHDLPKTGSGQTNKPRETGKVAP